MDGNQLRTVLLTVLDEYASNRPPEQFQSGSILRDVARRLSIHRDLEAEQMLLTYWHDLFRTGHLAWGYNVDNPAQPWCHLTERGRRALAHLNRDPMNPDGYLAYLDTQVALSAIPLSYITEALQTYGADCYKATAVMVGGAAESMALELRDTLVARITVLGQAVPKPLQDWRIKQVLDEIYKIIDSRKKQMPKLLSDTFDSYWLSFTNQIRATRNQAGHPSSVDPITPEQVHASLLIFPELAKLVSELESWINTNYT